MASKSQPRIAIIGAGPAGLTLGVLLHNRNVPFTIFELRQRPTDEELAKPAGSLDLHDESGLAAIKKCGLMDEFLPLTGECSEDTRISDMDGNILLAEEGFGTSRPEISRLALTKLLLNQLPENTVRWEYKLASATSSAESDETEIELDFGANGKHRFDLVVGADGAWSKVRSLLTDIKPNYSGIQNITVTIRNLTQQHPRLSEFIGRGTFNALGMRHGVCSQRGAQDSARIYVFISTPDSQFGPSSGLTDMSAVDAKDTILDDDNLLARWNSQIRDLISVACDADSADNPEAKLDIKPLYTLPVGSGWDHKPGATVIGDAAHLMCPWAGEGVNLAMWDSLELSRVIIRAFEAGADSASSFQDVTDPLLKEFEIQMIARSKEKAEETFRNGQVMFGEDGATQFVALLRSYGPPAE